MRPAVEHVIGGEDDKRYAELGSVLNTAEVDSRRLLRVRLCPVDTGPRSRVQDDVDFGEASGWGQGHIPVRTRQRDDAIVGELLAESRPELPSARVTRTPRGQFHAVSRTGARSFSGSHQARLAAYQSAVAWSPSSKEISGCQPSSRRSFEESSR